jgi:hypothetical protein
LFKGKVFNARDLGHVRTISAFTFALIQGSTT